MPEWITRVTFRSLGDREPTAVYEATADRVAAVGGPGYDHRVTPSGDLLAIETWFNHEEPLPAIQAGMAVADLALGLWQGSLRLHSIECRPALTV